MRTDSELAAKDFISPEDLWDKPLICSRQSLFGETIPRWLNKDLEKLNIVGTYNLVFNASLMVEEHMGYALALDKIVNVSSESNLCFKPFRPSLTAGLNVVWKRDQVFSKAAKEFLNRLEKEFREA